MADVPPVDQVSGADKLARIYEEVELRQIDADAKARENLNREADQRFHLRYWAVVVASLLMLLFVIIAIHILNSVPYLLDKKATPLLVVGLYVPPIAAVVTLSVSLLLAAFRGTKEMDGETAVQAGMNGAKIGSFLG